MLISIEVTFIAMGVKMSFVLFNEAVHKVRLAWRVLDLLVNHHPLRLAYVDW